MSRLAALASSGWIVLVIGAWWMIEVGPGWLSVASRYPMAAAARTAFAGLLTAEYMQ